MIVVIAFLLLVIIFCLSPLAGFITLGIMLAVLYLIGKALSKMNITYEQFEKLAQLLGPRYTAVTGKFNSLGPALVDLYAGKLAARMSGGIIFLVIMAHVVERKLGVEINTYGNAGKGATLGWNVSFGYHDDNNLVEAQSPDIVEAAILAAIQIK